jgi:hypothetical protein
MEQAAICKRARVESWEVDPLSVVGVGPLDRFPLNGLRHRPSGQSNGWYIWSGGEIPDDPDFFKPLHVDHLLDLAPEAMAYLALPPGWRFQVGPGHEDVWADDRLSGRLAHRPDSHATPRSRW